MSYSSVSSDLVAIVTGGGSGIGKATAVLLASKGVKVAICGRHIQSLQETITVIENIGGIGIAIEADVSKKADWQHLVQSVKEKYGHINILVNNAGVAIARPFLDLSEDEWDLMINTNLKSIFYGCKATIPEILKANHRVIINVASVLGIEGIPNFSAYCASKFGVVGFTQSIAREYHSQNIRVYSVCPGRTNTTMQVQLGGRVMADLSMPPEYIASKIVDLCGRVHPRYAQRNIIIIDKQSWQLKLYTLRQYVNYNLGKSHPILRKINRLIAKIKQ